MEGIEIRTGFYEQILKMGRCVLIDSLEVPFLGPDSSKLRNPESIHPQSLERFGMAVSESAILILFLNPSSDLS